MKKLALAALLLSGFVLGGTSCGTSSNKAGAPDDDGTEASAANPAMQAPDQVAWQLFSQVTAPAPAPAPSPPSGSPPPPPQPLFVTWASDTDTFKPNATWPTGAETSNGLDVHPAVLPTLHAGLGSNAANEAAAPPGQAKAAVKAAASAPPAPACSSNPPPLSGVNAEPASIPGGTLEEVRRNQAAFGYITGTDPATGKLVGQPLNSVSNLIKAFNANMTVNFPVDSIEMKTNWIPVACIPTYYPTMTTPEMIAENFYTTVDNENTSMALIAMHLISKQVPNWTWATFEHNLNPGRCDFLGCHDAFGAATPNVPPATDSSGNNQGTVYAPCTQTPALQALLAKVVAQFKTNYCLKGSQTDWTDNNGLAVRLGNSVTEFGFIQQASCMTCHGMANWDKTGNATTGGGFDNNTGLAQFGPIDPDYYWSASGPQPWFEGMNGLNRIALSADFVWSIPFCAYDDTGGGPPKLSSCAAQGGDR